MISFYCSYKYVHILIFTKTLLPYFRSSIFANKQKMVLLGILSIIVTLVFMIYEHSQSQFFLALRSASIYYNVQYIKWTSRGIYLAANLVVSFSTIWPFLNINLHQLWLKNAHINRGHHDRKCSILYECT
jgi:hypothetical protein